MKNIKKTKTKFVIVWGGNLKLRGEISSPKGPGKNTELNTSLQVK